MVQVQAQAPGPAQSPARLRIAGRMAQTGLRPPAHPDAESSAQGRAEEEEGWGAGVRSLLHLLRAVEDLLRHLAVGRSARLR